MCVCVCVLFQHDFLIFSWLQYEFVWKKSGLLLPFSGTGLGPLFVPGPEAWLRRVWATPPASGTNHQRCQGGVYQLSVIERSISSNIEMVHVYIVYLLSPLWKNEKGGFCEIRNTVTGLSVVPWLVLDTFRYHWSGVAPARSTGLWLVCFFGVTLMEESCWMLIENVEVFFWPPETNICYTKVVATRSFVEAWIWWRVFLTVWTLI